ncbi:MAG: MBL fold metallo-hydrolase [Actinobacteria bacterium]|nr:MBL fold metallo-hydrolase [Actinomycetota bacterium]
MSYRLDVLIQGFPGKSTAHGPLGWCTVSLLRGHGQVILVDTGGFSYRDLLVRRLAGQGVFPEQVTAVLLTHCHWDHICNYPLFSDATIFVGEYDLEWALARPAGAPHLPEFYVEKLSDHRRLNRLRPEDEFLPSLRALASPGHTPGHMSYIAGGEDGDIVLAGDAVKNQAELVTARVDLTLNPAESRSSIERLRALLAKNPSNVMVCGHDRLLSLENGQVVHRSELEAGIVARLTEEFDTEVMVDLASLGQPGSTSA